MVNLCGWFEIPVLDMERAMKFYETVFKIKLSRHNLGLLDMAWFPTEREKYGATGTLVHNKEYYKPSKDGVLIYFSCDDLDNELSRVEKAGGKILQKKKALGEHGFMALLIDSEGNRIALHSMK